MAVSPPINPILTYLPLNGNLAGRDRNGVFTATGAGALRWAPAENARVNYFTNPRLAFSQGSWTLYNAGGLTTLTGVRDTSIGCFGSTSYKVTFTGLDNPEYFIVNTSAGNRVSIPDLSKSYIVKYAVWASPTIAGRVTVNIQNNAYSRDDTYIAIVGGGGTMSSTGSLTITATSPSTPQIISKAMTSLPSLDNIRSLLNIYAGAGESNIAGDIWIGGCWFEELSTAGDYFDGSFPGCSWLDPRTGQLGSAHASPSCNQLTAWIEEGTTNLVQNPSYESAGLGGTQQTGSGQTFSKDTTTAYLGTSSLKIVCDGTASGQGAAFISLTSLGLTGVKTYIGSVYLRGSGTVRLRTRINYDSGYLDSALSSPITLTNTWTRYIAPTVTSNGTDTINYVSVRFSTNSAQAVTFYADCAQVEEKAYATSYVDGSIGTGYSWAGTAHASASTRAMSTITCSGSGRIDGVDGSALIKAEQPQFFATPWNQTLWSISYDLGDATHDDLNLRRSSSSTSMFYSKSGTAYSSEVQDSTLGSGWNSVYAGWSSAQISIAKDNGSESSTTRISSASGVFLDNVLYIGSSQHSRIYNGLIGPVAIFSRPLTDTRRAMVNTAIDNYQDLWTLFEEWEGIIDPDDLLALQSGEATAGVSAVLDPDDFLTLQSGQATAGVAAEVAVLELGLDGESVTAVTERPFPVSVTWRVP